MLPINRYIPDIIETINNNKFTIVISPTGTGKSIGIPAGLAEIGARVWVSTPNDIAAISLSKYQRYVNPNYNVGLITNRQIGVGDQKIKSENIITYATSNYVKNLLLSDAKTNLSNIDVLIIDDADTGLIDNSIIIDLWRYIEKNNVVARLLLLSSKLDVSKYPDAVVFEINQFNYPIDVRYHHRNYDVKDERLLNDTAMIVSQLHNSTAEGNMIIFVANRLHGEIISSLLNINDIEVYLFDDDTDISVLEQFYNDDKNTTMLRSNGAHWSRKIIITTNVLQQSVTLKNIGIVIDTMIERRSQKSTSGGFRIITGHISKNAAINRTGRTGRNMDGICYRMCTQDFYQRLPEFKPSEITRIPLYNTIISLIINGYDPVEIITEVNPEKTKEEINFLYKLGIISNNFGQNNQADQAGIFISHFPLGIRNSMILWKWLNQGDEQHRSGVIAIASLIDCYDPVENYLWYPQRLPGQSTGEYELITQEHTKTFFSKYSGRSNLETLANIWVSMIKEVIHGPGLDYLLEWTRQNSLNYNKILEVYNLVIQCINIGNQIFDLRITDLDVFDTQFIIDLLKPIISDVYSDRIMISQKNSNPIALNYSLIDDDSQVYILGESIISDMLYDKPDKLIALVISTAFGSLPKVNVINLSLDLITNKQSNLQISEQVSSEWAEEQQLQNNLMSLNNLANIIHKNK